MASKIRKKSSKKRTISSVSIVIPAYNEEKTILNILKRILGVKLPLEKEVVVVNDGSIDETSNLVKEFIKKNKIHNVKVFDKKNGGKGSSVRLGMNYSKGDIVIVQDADLEYDPEEYPLLIKPFLDRKAKVVYGSRILKQRQSSKSIFLRGKHMHASTLAYLGGITITFVTNLLFFSRLTDEPTCYKCFRRDVLDKINFKSNDFAWEPEITAKILKTKIKIFEVPISYHPRSHKEGKKIHASDAIKAILKLIEFRFR